MVPHPYSYGDSFDFYVHLPATKLQQLVFRATQWQQKKGSTAESAGSLPCRHTDYSYFSSGSTRGTNLALRSMRSGLSRSFGICSGSNLHGAWSGEKGSGSRSAKAFTRLDAARFLYGLRFVKHAVELIDLTFSDPSYEVVPRLSDRLFSGNYGPDHIKHQRVPKCSTLVHLGLSTSHLVDFDFCQLRQI